MDQVIRILHLEDNAADIELVQSTLESAGMACQISPVESCDEFTEALRKGGYDIILADYTLPAYDGLSALRLVQELCPDIPFIFVSGTMGEDAAIEGLTKGATDYVLKHNLSRLAPSVKRALHEAENQRERKQAEESVRRAKEYWERTFDAVPDLVAIIDTDFHIIQANKAMSDRLNLTPDECIGQICYEAVHGIKKPPSVCPHAQSLTDGLEHIAELREERLCGDFIVTTTPLFESDGRMIGSVHVARDITERKQAEEALRQSFHQLRETFYSLVNALISTVEKRDPYTAGHQRRTTILACAIAEEMGFSEERIEGIRMAGAIHDIGKIEVPIEILSRPGSLTDVQYEMVKIHPRTGYDILKEIKFPWPVAEIVLQHHERMDGSGYPQGIKGKKIMPEARILAVADVIEAMSHYRPFRPSLGIDKALEEISQNRGVLFDPDVVNTCIRLFAEKGFKFE